MTLIKLLREIGLALLIILALVAVDFTLTSLVGI